MEKKRLLKCIGIFLMFCYVNIGHSQNEIHYSQFYNATLNLNPGLTGIFNGDKRISGNYRSQWRSVPVDYFTVSANYDQKIYSQKNDKIFFGVGGNFNFDQAGDGKLGLLNLNLQGSFTYMVNQHFFLTPGIGVGFGQRTINSKGLNFADQWDGTQVIYNPTTGEKVDLDTKSFVYPETSAGLNIRLQNSSRTKIDVGAGFCHLNSPRMRFYSGYDSKLPVTMSVYGLGSLYLAQPFDLLLNAAYRKSDEYNETLLGAGLKVYLSSRRGKEFAIVGGVNFRTDDAWIPTVELHINQIRAGISYDINNSDFKIATEKKGGLEVSLQYIITEVKPLKDYRSCPVY
ncbi:MAG: PorP/SprF family type IX secretion system membrane protein [Saprospiraceae bacterium]|uniref:PorP/SprF family type IX secretion system membrane protein n=1 Tax=Candidatus Brachybacter algidus TaxID=2982024 RepID=UPI001B45B27E|nr:PorP/SprF family type IX secretion system membrane protein [Candidatus Brachybacter algidus]MBP7304599.1 PorP/SprF family type IX secretion system membrane protein [Saprospiraceae bacterium]MBK6448298.1 PorP/SprF family type IX secretion system membrane protein [Candidatus Brachybacter algidus]MBK8354215.1 PorP/SprF family type IX secretion system membrane protein [Candidatus Brachybacter algidus]MBK8602612.1 PorP/SprF family type IX secretion system membrane protein [Candidatus Brachybacter